MALATSLSASRALRFALVGLLVLSVVPGVAAAEPRAGGTVVVEEGETVDGVEAFGGTVVVRGTVDGDLQAFGGDVRIEGEVTGDVEAFAGNVWIGGRVGGDVETAAGNVYVAPDADVAGSLSAAAGSVVVAGSIGGSAELAGGTVTLADSAAIDGDVEYGVERQEDFQDEGAAVGGSITRVDNVDAGLWERPEALGWAFGVYGFLVNLLLGALLLLVFPQVSAGVARDVGTDPLRTAVFGLVTIVAIPFLLVALVITVVGIPLALVGGLLFGVLLWIALVYGRFAIGVWLLSLVDVENRWAGLFVGLLLLGLVARIPWAGGLIDFVVVLLGLGGLAEIGYRRYRGRWS